MQKSIVMFTGVPGAGKTTIMEGTLDVLKDVGVSVEGVDEYGHLGRWADLPESKQWLFPPKPRRAFDIRPEGYLPMSEYVGRWLAEDINRSFSNGKSLVVFETARGVGEPRVDYSDFLEMVTRHLEVREGDAKLVNIEVLSTVKDIETRMMTRFLEDPEHAPPPGIEKKYLGEGGYPLCYATEDLEHATLDLPLVMNESVTNGAGKEALRIKVESELYPKLMEALGLPPRSPEGHPRGPEIG